MAWSEAAYEPGCCSEQRYPDTSGGEGFLAKKRDHEHSRSRGCSVDSGVALEEAYPELETV